MAAPPPSQFATLLRRSKFASFDPNIAQVYTTFDGHAARGNFGLKRPLALRRRNAYISVQAVDSREQQTVWKSAEQEARWIKMWDEVGVKPGLLRNSFWGQRVGPLGLEVSYLVDTEFAPRNPVPQKASEGEDGVQEEIQEDAELQEGEDGEVLLEGENGEVLLEGENAEALLGGEDGEALLEGEDGQVVMEGEDGEALMEEDQTTPKPTHVDTAMPPISEALPNFEVMSEKEFERYLQKLRELRPAFREFLAKRDERAREGDEFRLDDGQTKSLLHRSVIAGDEYREFLQAHAYKEYHAPVPRQIEQQPHRDGGLSYTQAPYIQSMFTTKPRPGRVIAEQSSHVEVAFAGRVATLLKGDRGEDKNLVVPTRMSPRPLLQRPPEMVGSRLEGLKETRLSNHVRVESETNHYKKEVPFTPGSREYIGLPRGAVGNVQIPPAPDMTAASNVPSSFTMADASVASGRLLHVLGSSLFQPVEPKK